MKQNFRYITKFEEETRAERLETRAIGTIDGILNASKLLLTASKKLLRYCDKENNPFVEKLTQFIQTLEAHIQMASRVEKLGLKELSLQYGMDSDNIVSLVGQFYFVDYRKQGVTQREFEGLMDDVVAKGDEVDSLANLADRSSSARLETRSLGGGGEQSLDKYQKDFHGWQYFVVYDYLPSMIDKTLKGWQIVNDEGSVLTMYNKQSGYSLEQLNQLMDREGWKLTKKSDTKYSITTKKPSTTIHDSNLYKTKS